MNLLIVVVNYKSADLTIDALASVEGQLSSVAPARVVVVDNESGDGSYEKLSRTVVERHWGDWVTVVAAGRNGGFAYGNNVGLAYAREHWPRPRYVQLLNPDTVVRPDGLRALVAFMDANPAVGIAGSRLENPDGTPQRSAFRFPSALGELESMARIGPISRLLRRWVVAPEIPSAVEPTDWVAGASMIIRQEVFDAIGLLDEKYFMYFEEVDFILRAANAGWPCWYTPESRVVHLVGQTSGVTDPRQRRRRRPQYWFDSRRRYMVTHLGHAGAVLADVAFLTGYALWNARRAVFRLPDADPEKLLADFVRNSVIVKGFNV